MIIQNQQQNSEDFTRDQEEIVKEIIQYKRINASLKKKIQARDKKINYMFSQVDHLSKSSIQQTHEISSIRKNMSEVDPKTGSKQVSWTGSRNKQKQNVSNSNRNLFKDKTMEYSNIIQRPNFKLPTLGRKNIFAEDPEFSDNRPRLIKVSLEKLIPIKPEQIKRKFELKYRAMEQSVE